MMTGSTHILGHLHMGMGQKSETVWGPTTNASPSILSIHLPSNLLGYPILTGDGMQPTY